MNRNTRFAAGRTSAFTLIELLVVVTIIGMLLALLLPALGRVLAYAENLQCQSNLKQIATAVLSYTTDYRGTIPPTRCEKSGLYWCNLLAMREVASQNAVDLPENQKSVQNSVLLCPASTDQRIKESDPRLSNPDAPEAQGWFRVGRTTTDKPIMTDCSYYWNGYTGSAPAMVARFPSLAVNESSPNVASQFHDLAEILKRSTMVMAADGLFWDGFDQPERIAARHTGSRGDHFLTNVAFYDSHVEAIDRYAEGTFPNRNWAAEENAEEGTDLIPIMIRSPNLEGGPPYFMLPKR